MMGEPVEQGGGVPFGAEYGSPFIERQVAGDQRGATFIALAEGRMWKGVNILTS
jgi:hypothetical protein